MGDTWAEAAGRVARLAHTLQLPEIAEGTSYGTPALKVRDKSFTRLKDPQTLVLLVPLEQKEVLMEMAPRAAGERLRVHQVKSKTGTVKGGDGRRLGAQLRQLGLYYDAEMYFDALIRAGEAGAAQGMGGSDPRTWKPGPVLWSTVNGRSVPDWARMGSPG